MISRDGGTMRVILTFGLFLMLLLPGLAAATSDLADAVMKQDTEAVRSMLQRKMDINAAQADGTTALHWAAQWDDTALAELLIGNGANVRAANRDGATPMTLACT